MGAQTPLPHPRDPNPWKLLIRQLISHVLSTTVVSLFLGTAFVQDLINYLKFKIFNLSVPPLARTLRPHHPEEVASALPPSDVRTAEAPSPYDIRVPNWEVGLYADWHGYKCVEYEITSDDGFVLVMHRLCKKGASFVGRLGRVKNQFLIWDADTRKEPILLMHGLFQSSGIFCTSGPNSLAYYLVDHGYDVWLGNIRCVRKDHAFLSSYDPRFWNWSLDEIARFDVPAIIDFVREETRREQIIYVGHSQGNAQAFLAMQYNPPLGDKLKCFVALAPAVYTGPLLEEGPVSLLMNCPPNFFTHIFGTKEFLGIMSPAQYYLPADIFATLAYRMFNWLFGWTDTNWSPLDKPHHFRFTPRPTSSKAVLHWCRMAKRGGVYGVGAKVEDVGGGMGWSDGKGVNVPPPPVDLGKIRCDLMVFYGSEDRIVDGEKLIRNCGEVWGRSASRTERGGRLVLAELLEGYEHMDVVWARDAKERVFDKMIAAFEGSCN
ncbi:hypothetical protein HDV00_010427 [Rhizophlyctis rosea]|nr:hypothetical protein HDV00_010427 [Rhizophlyctis rosea]